MNKYSFRKYVSPLLWWIITVTPVCVVFRNKFIHYGFIYVVKKYHYYRLSRICSSEYQTIYIRETKKLQNKIFHSTSMSQKWKASHYKSSCYMTIWYAIRNSSNKTWIVSIKIISLKVYEIYDILCALRFHCDTDFMLIKIQNYQC